LELLVYLLECLRPFLIIYFLKSYESRPGASKRIYVVLSIAKAKPNQRKPPVSCYFHTKTKENSSKTKETYTKRMNT
jgi:hypothetical protein